MSAARPDPSSSGQLTRTPLAHLLVYAAERRLAGTFEFHSAGLTATVLVQAGQPAKVRLPDPPIYLGQVLVELGSIQREALDASLRRMAAERRLQGQVLLDQGALTRTQLDEGLRVQVLRKLAQVARVMPPTAVFEFYADWDGLSEFGAEPVPCDPFAAVWTTIREQPSLEHVKAALERLGRGRLRLARTAQLDRFVFTPQERRWIDLLRVRPLSLDDFFFVAEINERLARLVAYCLAITKQVELVSEEDLPRSEGSDPSVRSDTKVPSSPRQPVARMALKRERVRTNPVIVEEHAQTNVDTRRATPPPDAALVATEVRRAEILDRAQKVDKQNYFEMLGVAVDASVEDVKAAYILLAKTWHPDRLSPALVDLKDQVGRVFARITEAHQTLTDEEKRRRYLRLMREGGETPEQQQEIANVVGATVEFQKAEICLRKNDIPQALVLASHALELDPNQADYVALAAWLRSLDPNAQSAEATQVCIDQLDRALKINERCERAYFYRAMLHKKQHRDALAYRDFKRVTEINAKNIDAQRELRLYDMRTAATPPTGTQRSSKPPGLLDKLFKKS